jgi:hypothetical protein
MAGCIHSDYDSDETCRKCRSKEARAFQEKVASLSLQFTYGRETFHGPTINEQISETKAHAKQVGIKVDVIPAADKYRWI